jgi:hypothetical protein
VTRQNRKGIQNWFQVFLDWFSISPTLAALQKPATGPPFGWFELVKHFLVASIFFYGDQRYRFP